MKSFLPGLLTLVLISIGQLQANSREVKLGEVKSGTDCGSTIHMHEGDTATIVSGNGNPSGFCSVLFHAMDTADHKCSGICLKVSDQDIEDCHSSHVIKGLKFASTTNDQKELSCFKRFPEEWCFETSSMTVESIRDLDYPSSVYSFNLSVSIKCDLKKDHEARLLAEEKEKVKAEDSQTTMNTIKGVVVGVCLACMFLIVLFLTYCYYKNRAYRGKRYDYPSSTFRKGPSLSGFKAKFNIHKGNNAKGTSNDEPEPKYTKRDEAVPLVPTSGSKVEEPPTVEIIDEEKQNNTSKHNEEENLQQTATEQVPEVDYKPPPVPEVKVDEAPTTGDNDEGSNVDNTENK